MTNIKELATKCSTIVGIGCIANNIDPGIGKIIAGISGSMALSHMKGMEFATSIMGECPVDEMDKAIVMASSTIMEFLRRDELTSHHMIAALQSYKSQAEKNKKEG